MSFVNRTKAWMPFGLTIFLVLGTSAPAFAWGSDAQVSIASTGVSVASQDMSIPLNKLDRFTREGARIGRSETQELFPNFDIDPIGTIEEEMYLLQAVKGDRIDPYYMYRIGALGKLIAIATAPLAHDGSPYRDRYLVDAERHVHGVEINTSPRMLVDSQVYFLRILRAAAANDETIILDYSSGLGFGGVAGASLSVDMSRSVDAVADVVYTLFSSKVAVVNVKRAAMRDYALRGLSFYLRSGNLLEARDAYDRIVALGVITTELKKQIADVYFKAEEFEIAIELYAAVLKESPEHRDVAEKIATYHEGLGDAALSLGQLEVARDAYSEALEVQVLNEIVRRKFLNVQRDINDREARLASARMARKLGREYEAEAQKESKANNHAQAISYLREAEAQYGSVTNEFPDEAKSAGLGLRNVQFQIKELKQKLVKNVQQLSGSGFSQEARRLGANADNVQQEAFEALVDSELNSAMQGLANQMENALKP